MSMKSALVTGGNKGIGLEVTKMFVSLGFEVIVLARDFEEFEFGSHAQVHTVVCDLTNENQIVAIIDQIDHVDILVNNAGIMYAIPFDQYPKEKVEFMIALNLKAPIKLIEKLSTKMPKGGRIVNNASIAGQIGHPDIWYGITKAGLINATKSFAKIFDGNIIVNAVAPSPVETDMLNVIPKERREAFLKTVTSKRFATAEEVAKTIVWLATESPAYINGTCIDINDTSLMR